MVEVSVGIAKEELLVIAVIEKTRACFNVILEPLDLDARSGNNKSALGDRKVFALGKSALDNIRNEAVGIDDDIVSPKRLLGRIDTVIGDGGIDAARDVFAVDKYPIFILFGKNRIARKKHYRK